MSQSRSLAEARTRQPGKLYSDLLYQDEVWWTRDGQLLRIEEMKTSHVRNLLAYLRRAKNHLKQSEEWAWTGMRRPQGEQAGYAFDDGFDSLLRTDPEDWVESLPLVQRLVRELETRNERSTGRTDE